MSMITGRGNIINFYRLTDMDSENKVQRGVVRDFSIL